ncbi:unnamed protein product [Fusarium graminearum]|nr:unnamed protein product [Fusarium graminearum]VTO81845.1 unnamed protein product [Fusarium graminearum]
MAPLLRSGASSFNSSFIPQLLRLTASAFTSFFVRQLLHSAASHSARWINQIPLTERVKRDIARKIEQDAAMAINMAKLKLI